jgi:hypothetical protein
MSRPPGDELLGLFSFILAGRGDDAEMRVSAIPAVFGNPRGLEENSPIFFAHLFLAENQFAHVKGGKTAAED